jgi:hypothetical protein
MSYRTIITILPAVKVYGNHIREVFLSKKCVTVLSASALV